MVSDLFNHNLKCLVDNLCNDISNELAQNQTVPFTGASQSQSQSGAGEQAQAAGQIGSQNSLFVADPATNWWPPELGTPTAVGSQNNLRYAYFASAQRLAVTTGGTPWVYDTLDLPRLWLSKPCIVKWLPALRRLTILSRPWIASVH